MGRGVGQDAPPSQARRRANQEEQQGSHRPTVARPTCSSGQFALLGSTFWGRRGKRCADGLGAKGRVAGWLDRRDGSWEIKIRKKGEPNKCTLQPATRQRSAVLKYLPNTHPWQQNSRRGISCTRRSFRLEPQAASPATQAFPLTPLVLVAHRPIGSDPASVLALAPTRFRLTTAASTHSHQPFKPRTVPVLMQSALCKASPVDNKPTAKLAPPRPHPARSVQETCENGTRPQPGSPSRRRSNGVERLQAEYREIAARFGGPAQLGRPSCLPWNPQVCRVRRFLARRGRRALDKSSHRRWPRQVRKQAQGTRHLPFDRVAQRPMGFQTVNLGVNGTLHQPDLISLRGNNTID